MFGFTVSAPKPKPKAPKQPWTWQHQMSHRGWRVARDGKYGPQSRSVCLQFQAEKGLAADGLVGPRTWEASWTAPVT